MSCWYCCPYCDPCCECKKARGLGWRAASPIQRRRRVVPLTIGNPNVVPLTIGNPNVVPLTIGNPNVVPLTIGDHFVATPKVTC